MISQVFIIVGLLILYVLSIIALHFTGISAGKTEEAPVLPEQEESH